MRRVHVIVPSGIDDPARPSGGNVYDRRVCDALMADGWSVSVLPVDGDWPAPDDSRRSALAAMIRAIPDGATVLIDGLIASAAPQELIPHADRLRVVVLMHMPLGLDGDGAARRHEGRVLAAATAVITTSRWTAAQIVAAYGVATQRLHVATPGVDPAEEAVATSGGGELVCVAAVIPGKGHDVMVDALARVADLPWRMRCVGTLERDPAFVERLRRRLEDHGIGGRVTLTGALTGPALDDAYAATDLMVLASRAETYGMVVTEALARAIPVVAGDVGGVGEALGRAQDGHRPGILVPPGDAEALGDALRGWLRDPDLRARLRAIARSRRGHLSSWSETAAAVGAALAESAA